MTKIVVEAHGYMDFFEGGNSLRNGDSPKDGVCLHMMGPFYYLGSQSIRLTQYVCLSVCPPVCSRKFHNVRLHSDYFPPGAIFFMASLSLL